MERICVGPPGAALLDNVCLNLYAGEIIGLCGLEDSGRHELLACLTGMYPDFTGDIRKDELKLSIEDMRHTMGAGICVIGEKSTLIGEFSALENLELLPRTLWGCRSRRVYREKCRRLMEQICPEVEPDTPMRDLTGYDRVTTEIVKATLGRADTLVLDGVLAAFPDYYLRRFERLFRRLSSDGVSIIISDTSLRIFRLFADRLFVLRNGMNAGKLGREEMDDETVLAMMTGIPPEVAPDRCAGKAKPDGTELDTDMSSDRKPSDFLEPEGRLLLEVRELRLGNVLKGLNLKLCEREILGILNFNKNSGRYFVDILEEREKPDSGEILYCGQDISGMRIARRQELGVYVIAGEGRSYPQMSIEDNIAIPAIRRFNRFGVECRMPELRYEIGEVMEEFWPECVGWQRPEQGGMAERMLMICRALAAGARLLVMRNIAQGLDVQMKRRIAQLIKKLHGRGITLMLIDFDVEFLAGLCDRICVISEGRCIMQAPADDQSIQELKRRYGRQMIQNMEC